MDAIKVIKNAQEHASAVARLLDLMMTEGDEEQIELLALVIQDYERKVSPSPSVDPIDAIHFRMEQMGMRPKDLVPYIGSQSKVSEVLDRKRPLTLAMMRKLYQGLGIPADVLLGEDGSGFDLSTLPEFEYPLFPLQEMAERGYFGEDNKTKSARSLKERAEEYITDFLKRVAAFGQPDLAFLRSPQTQKGMRGMNDYGLLVWMLRVKELARQEKVTGVFSREVISEAWLRDLVKLSAFKDGPKLAKEYLARYGIALVVEPHFQKTYLDGAALKDGGLAIIGITLRHDRLDHFWFVLLHEIAHLKFHVSDECPEIADNLDDKVQQSEQIEREADAFASDTLIPIQAWQASAVKDSYALQDAQHLAQELGISLAIIAGRVRHETGNWRLLGNCLGKGQVKEIFGIGK